MKQLKTNAIPHDSHSNSITSKLCTDSRILKINEINLETPQIHISECQWSKATNLLNAKISSVQADPDAGRGLFMVRHSASHTPMPCHTTGT